MAESRLVANEPAPPQAAHEAAGGPPAAPPGTRLLVADDDPRICRSFASALARVGFHVFTADDSEPAVELAAHAPPDVALVDLNMPTPGLVAVERLRAGHGPALFIAVLSGYDDDDTRAECLAAGADDVLGKPIPIAELRRRMVDAALARQEQIQARLARRREERRRQRDGAATAAPAPPRTSLNNVRALLHELIDLHAPAPLHAPAALHAPAPLHAPVPLHASALAVRLELDCDPALAGQFDLALIEHALDELVAHALRLAPEGGAVRLSARSWGTLAPSGVELAIHIAGADAAGDADPLDLAPGLVRLACEAHGGALAYRAADGGAAFYLQLSGRP
jgi:two-component system KDP operon response regulator KdpE